MKLHLQRPLLLATACIAAALASGCSMMGDNRSSTSTASSASAAGALSADDRMFANMAAGNGMYEVGVGRLAVSRAIDPRVKAYGQMLSDHHTMANNELMALLSAQGMAPPTSIPADKVAKTQALSSSTGAAFDRQFIRTVGLDDHTSDIALFERESANGSDPGLRAFATKTLPVLREHLRQAQALSASLR